MSGSLISRLETADTSADRLILFSELHEATIGCPDLIGPFAHFIQLAFCDPLHLVRRLAYQCASNYISSNPSMAGHFTSAYFNALLHNQADISLHALSFLPEFITACRSNSAVLLGAAATAARRWPSPDSTANLARAAAAFRCVDLEESNNSQSVQ